MDAPVTDSPAFRWGVATSAYQIEGATHADGRGPSIWDTFCQRPGAIADGSDGSVACDHYRRMPSDVSLIASLGVDTYRFSIAWPRVQPTGRGVVNAAGLDFYSRLVDELLRAGVEPWVTLYHWDLPQALEDAGGWPLRDTAFRFADYAMAVFDRLGDRVRYWTTLNEPWCVAMYGYRDGFHAPGRRDPAAAMRAVHHLLLGHGLAVSRMRAAAPQAQVSACRLAGQDVTGRAVDQHFGITLNLTPSVPATAEDVAAARAAEAAGMRLCLDPLLRGRYPAGFTMPVRPGDMEIIGTPLDFLGVNYYYTETVSATGPVRDGPLTAMGWPVTPDGLTDLLLRLKGIPLYVTENGAVFDDDADRIAFLDAHIKAVMRARDRGADVRGYFVWSLLDNFEWAHGFGPRFGLVHVDNATQERTLKPSARWYARFVSGVGRRVPGRGDARGCRVDTQETCW